MKKRKIFLILRSFFVLFVWFHFFLFYFQMFACVRARENKAAKATQWRWAMCIYGWFLHLNVYKRHSCLSAEMIIIMPDDVRRYLFEFLVKKNPYLNEDFKQNWKKSHSNNVTSYQNIFILSCWFSLPKIYFIFIFHHLACSAVVCNNSKQ